MVMTNPKESGTDEWWIRFSRSTSMLKANVNRDYKLACRSLKIVGVDGSVLFTVTLCCVTMKDQRSHSWVFFYLVEAHSSNSLTFVVQCSFYI